MDTERPNLSLEQALAILRRRGSWIVLSVVLVAGAAYFFSHHQTKKYTATAALVFNSNQLGQQIAGFQGTGGGESQQTQQNTNIRLLQLGDVAAKTAHRLHGLSAADVRRALGISSPAESNIVNVSAVATTPQLAAGIANTYAKEFVAEQQNRDHAYYAAALALTERKLASLSSKEKAGPVGESLQVRAQSLGVLAALRNGNVRLAQSAPVPGSPSSPNVSRNTALGAVIGLLLGLGIALLIERLDRRIREPEDLKAIYAVPLLGVVPESAVLARAGKSRRWPLRRKKPREGLPAREEEAFQLIRAHLRYFNVDRELRTLLVVSAGAGEGKTTVARHLASAAARMGSVVLLLEADLREPALAGQLALRPGPGLADVLIGDLSLWSATQLVDVDSAPIDGSAGRSLDVLTAGVPLPPNPAKLIESQAMEGVLEEARSTYDLVVIDTPPLAAVSDAFPLLRKVDGTIIVGRGGRNRRDVALRLRETLLGARAPVLGVVANAFRTGRLSTYDPYARGYPAAEPTRAAVVSGNGAVSAGDPLGLADRPGASRQDPAASGHDGRSGQGAERR